MGETNLSNLSEIGKKYLFLLLFWIWDIYFSHSFLFLRRCWKSRMQTFGKGSVFLLHPSFMSLWSLPASQREGARPWLLQREHWQAFTAQWWAALWLPSGCFSPHLKYYCCYSSKYLLYLCTSTMFHVSAFTLSLAPIKRTTHCGSVVIWTSTTLHKFIKSIIVVNLA